MLNCIFNTEETFSAMGLYFLSRCMLREKHLIPISSCLFCTLNVFFLETALPNRFYSNWLPVCPFINTNAEFILAEICMKVSEY